MVTLADASAAIAALGAGTVDASFRAVTAPAGQLPGGIRAARVFDEPVQLLTGPAHPLAEARAVRPGQLAGHPIWMPGLVPGAEWTAYYDDLAAAFGLSIDVTGPHFGTEPLLDVVAASATLATLVGEQTQLHWPDGHDLRRISLHDPAPVYPHSLIWHNENPHPGLTALRRHLCASPGRQHAAGTWTPPWADPDRWP